MLAAEAARKSVKEQQAIALRNLIESRGDVSGQTVSSEEQALADLILRQDPLPLAVSGDGTLGTGAAIGSAAFVSAPLSTGAPAEASAQQSTQFTGPPRTTIRIHVLVGDIDKIARAVANEKPIDCMAIGHYLRVRPTGAERDIDRAITAFFRGAEPPVGSISDEDLILLQFHDRGLLRGELGVPFYMPNPRPGYEGNLIVIAGMGPTGRFGVPELSLLARELSWSLGQLGKNHLATVLIGASKKNLSFADAIHGWLVGLNRALASSVNSGSGMLEAVTFVIRPSTSGQDPQNVAAVVTALQRETKAMREDPSLNFDIQLVDMPAVTTQPRQLPREIVATRISIEFEDGVCRYSALTDGASIAERAYKINPKRIADVNQRLLATVDERQKYRLGKFLLQFLFPLDLRSQLTGSAPIVLACDNEAAKVYWELAAQPLEDEVEDGFGEQNYLGLTRGLSRQLKTVLAPPPEPPPPVGRILRVLLVADASKEHPLPGAQQEAQKILDLFERVHRMRFPVPSAFTDLPPYDLLHYAGHCFYDSDHPERSGLLFSGEDVLTAGDLDRIDRTPKFVFANACESGIMPSRPDLSSPELPAAFAEAFFKKGVANFVCTAWPVDDDAARDFAEELYRCLLGDGVPPMVMFHATRRARQRIAKTQTWAAYQHYGGPYFRLFRSPSEVKV
jgi:CHAT domain